MSRSAAENTRGRRSLIAQRLHRIEAGAAPRRQAHGEQRQDEREQDDPDDVGSGNLGRHARQVVDVFGKQLDVKEMLQAAADRLDTIAHDEPEDDASGGADDADAEAAHQEDPHDRALGRAHRAKNGDLAGLVADHQHLPGNDVERGDERDQPEHGQQHRALHLQPLEEAGAGMLPVGNDEPLPGGLIDVAADAGGVVEIADVDHEARRGVLGPEEQLSGLERHVHHAFVEEIHADLEDPDDVIRLGAGNAADDGAAGFRHDQRDGIADADVEVLGQPRSQDDDVGAGEIMEVAALDVPRHELDLLEIAAPYRVNEGARRVVGRRRHHLAVNRRQYRGDARHGPDLRRDVIEVVDVLAGRGQAEMAVDAEDRIQDLGAETVHDGEHDDQRRHAEADAEQREPGDNGDQAFASARPQIAEGDQAFEGGNGHRARVRSGGLGQELGQRRVDREFLPLARGTALQLDLPGGDAARADDQLPRQPDEVHLGELGAGALVAIVVEDLDAGAAQLPID